MKYYVQGGATEKLPLVAKAHIGVYLTLILTTGIGLCGLIIFVLGKVDARLKWLDFSVFNRPVSAVICDWGIVSYLCFIVIFLIFRKSLEQHAPQITEYLENSVQKRANQRRNRL